MIRKSMKFALAVFGACAGATVGAAAASADDVLYLPHDASYCEIFRGMSRILPGECSAAVGGAAGGALRGQPVTRAIVRRSTELAMADNGLAEMPESSDERGIALQIQFDFDSASLSPQSTGVLDRIAAVLNSDLVGDAAIRIEGHADAVGSEAYNQLLSERRAVVVSEYLVTKHRIDPRRIEHVGKGESEPLLHTDPTDGVNRRVQFINVNG